MRQLFHALTHQLIGVHLVSAGGELDAQARRRLAVIAAQIIIFLRAQRHLRHVAQRHYRAVGIGLQGNGLELFRRLQQRLRVDRGVERLLVHRRQAADLTDGNLRVLRLDGAYHVVGGQRVGDKPGGIEPDTHRILRAVGVNLADAVDAAQRILNIAGDIVCNILFIHAAVGGDESDHQDIAVAGFVDRHALRLHRLRQLAQRRLQLVLHLLARFVGIGAGREGEGDLRLTGIATVGRHIHQIVDTGHILLDNLSDGVFQRFGRGARIVGGDAHVRRRQVGILLNGQGNNRQRAAQAD